MIRLLLIFGLILSFTGYSSADEEYDSMLYLSEDEDAEFKADTFDNIQTYSPTPVIKNESMSSPAIMDDADMNFDDIVNAVTEEGDAPEVGISPENKEFKKEKQKLEIAKDIEEGKGLSDTLKSDTGLNLTDKSTSPATELKDKLSDSWIGKIKPSVLSSSKSDDAGINTSDVSLENMVDSAKTSKQKYGKSNVSVFDISGAMLRMSFEQIDRTLSNRGYKQTMQKLDIPNFIRWRNEDKCRSSGVVGYERLSSCVVQLAKQDNHQYIFSASYSKFDTKENIDIYFTSNFTLHKAYKITYTSEAVNIGGNSPKMIYLRNIKIYDFWKKINQKYGTPDNKDDVMWGAGGTKPYMQAGTGRLILEDPMLRELDYTRMSREDQRYMNTDLYSF